ncbi:uncharacterized protein LOC142364008 isoform X2 [Opisthocomus hoazin]|uniref:uncharacterized protein LOC142364008 isoform X2 n=1 Tax=Opisthocomus hoazin TaxID=30419 RepID=UPI003F53482F
MSEQTGETNSVSDEGSAGSLGISGVAHCGPFQPPPSPWKASPSRQQALLGPCTGPREIQVSGRERVGSCVAYRARANFSPQLGSHDLAELSRRGGTWISCLRKHCHTWARGPTQAVLTLGLDKKQLRVTSRFTCEVKWDCHLAQQEKFALSPWDGMRLQATEIPRRKEQLQFVPCFWHSTVKCTINTLH